MDEDIWLQLLEDGLQALGIGNIALAVLSAGVAVPLASQVD